MSQLQFVVFVHSEYTQSTHTGLFTQAICCTNESHGFEYHVAFCTTVRVCVATPPSPQGRLQFPVTHSES
jgi:hypothetical protein